MLELDDERTVDAPCERTLTDAGGEHGRDDEGMIELLGTEIEIDLVVLAQDIDQSGLPLRVAHESGVLLRLRRCAAE